MEVLLVQIKDNKKGWHVIHVDLTNKRLNFEKY